MLSTPHKVLMIVEDESSLAKFLRTAFIQEGFSVISLDSGEGAIAEALSVHPSAILLDIMLPGINGMNVLSKLRKDPWGKTVPVLILTNLAAGERIMGGIIRDEPSYYIMKANPSVEDIVAKVKSAIKSDSGS